MSASLLLMLCAEWLAGPFLLHVRNGDPQQRQSVIQISTPDAHLLRPIKADHPYLFFRANDIAIMQSKAVTTHEEIWKPILDYAKTQLGTAPPASAPPGGDVETYRNYGNQMIALAFACVITAYANYCELAKTYLLVYATWQQWGENNERGLGHAQMLLGNAIGYDWLYNRLTLSERRRVRTSLANWTWKMYEASSKPYQATWNNWWRASYLQNYYWTTHSALGVASLALLGEDGRAQTWLNDAIDKLARGRDFLNGIEDGSWHESIAYQQIMLSTTLPFWVSLRYVKGINLIPQYYLRNYVYWLLYNHIPNSTQFILMYGDFEWSWFGVMSHLLRFMAREYKNGYAEWLAERYTEVYRRKPGIWSAPWYVFEFLYYDPTIAPLSPSNLPKSRVFTDLQALIWRTGWDDNDLIFALKAGGYGGRFAIHTFTNEVYPWEPPCIKTGCQLNIGHDHDDSASFYLFQARNWLAPETEGVDKVATAFHNTLVIDQQSQYRPPANHFDGYPEDFKDSDGFITATGDTPDFDYAVVDATHRYKNIPTMSDVSRRVLFVRPNYFVMLDNLAADQAHDYTWVGHFGQTVSLEKRWIKGVAGDGQVLGIGIAAPQAMTTSVGDDGHPYVHIQPAAPTKQVRFLNLLYPTDEAHWASKPAVNIIEDTGSAIATQVKMNDGMGRIDNVLLTYTQTYSTTLGSYTYDGQAAVVSRGKANGLEKLFIYGATFLTDNTQKKSLVAGLQKNTALEAIFASQTVSVYANSNGSITLYAPQAKLLILNGRAWPFVRGGDYIHFNTNLLPLP